MTTNPTSSGAAGSAFGVGTGPGSAAPKKPTGAPPEAAPTPAAPDPRYNQRGAVDLSSLQRAVAPPPGQPGGAPAAGGFVVDVTDETFPQIVEGSAKYPVIALLWLPTDAVNAELATTLGQLADEYAGQFLLARIDAVTYPQIAAAFGVQGVPTVVAVVQGQPIPLFAGNADTAQIKAVLGEILDAAKQAGVTGRAPGASEPLGPPILEPELPPLHQEAFDAIDRNDLDAAIDAYQRALKQDPSDTMAQAGLAQVQLMQRTHAADLDAVRAAAAKSPTDVSAALAVADADMLGGHVEDAFDRLLKVMADADAEDKERIRKRIVDYFDLIGQTDPRVNKARKQLTMLLY